MEDKGFYIRDSLLSLATTLDGQTVMLARIAADVEALKAVLTLAFGPEVATALADEIKARSGRYQQVVESQKLMLEALKKGISKIPN